MIEVRRSFAGICIRGERIAVAIDPLVTWRLPGNNDVSLSVDACVAHRGNEWARITDPTLAFARDELELTPGTGRDGADELRALARYVDAPAFRAGFVLELEPGMRAFVETELVRVARVTELAGALALAVEAHLGRTPEQFAWTTLKPHEGEALLLVAAGTVLDGYGPVDAVRYTVACCGSTTGREAFSDDGDDPRYTELGAALRQPDVQALLAGHTGQYTGFELHDLISLRPPHSAG